MTFTFTEEFVALPNWYRRNRYTGNSSYTKIYQSLTVKEVKDLVNVSKWRLMLVWYFGKVIKGRTLMNNVRIERTR